MSFKESAVLVVGSGSIGRRHTRNIHQLGFSHIAVCDTNADRMQVLVDELQVTPFTDYEMALREFTPQIVFICTPPVYHVSQARLAIEHNAHVFIEKPLSNTLDDIDMLIAQVEKSQCVVHIGYNLRFHPGLQKVKALINDGALGQLFWARIEIGQYLPDWRPWQDYRQSYTARKELGGGIILDASHEIDYALWLFGQPTALMCMAGNVSDLAVNVEDCATILVRFEDGMQADIHLDFVQRHYSRSLKLTGSKGAIEWTMTENSVHFQHVEGEVKDFPYQFEANNMYIEEAKAFFDAIQKNHVSVQHLQAAKQTLKVALAAHESNKSGKRVTL